MPTFLRPWVVVPSNADVDHAIHEAELMSGAAVKRNAKARYGDGAKVDPLDQHIIGRMGEIICGWALSLPAPLELGNLDRHDIGDRTEVRTRNYYGSGRDLFFTPDDIQKMKKRGIEDAPFLLAWYWRSKYGKNYGIKLVGWQWSSEIIKAEEHFIPKLMPRYKDGVWIYPYRKTNPVETLPEDKKVVPTWTA